MLFSGVSKWNGSTLKFAMYISNEKLLKSFNEKQTEEKNFYVAYSFHAKHLSNNMCRFFVEKNEWKAKRKVEIEKKNLVDTARVILFKFLIYFIEIRCPEKHLS